MVIVVFEPWLQKGAVDGPRPTLQAPVSAGGMGSSDSQDDQPPKHESLMAGKPLDHSP